MYLQLFGGRGGSSGGGGVREESGFEALANGVLDEDLTEKQDRQVKEYLLDFLRDVSKLKDGQSITAEKYGDYVNGRSLEDMKDYVKNFLSYDYDTGDIDIEATMRYWDEDRRVYVSYDASGEKYHNYYFDDESDFRRLSKELKGKKIKGIIFSDGWETAIGGKGITVRSPKDDNYAWFTFEQGKLPKKKK
jgi:hypothetical protein